MTRRRPEFELFQCVHVDKTAEIEQSKRQAAINAAHRHVQDGEPAKPWVIKDKKYRAVYLQEYQRLTQVAARVG